MERQKEKKKKKDFSHFLFLLFYFFQLWNLEKLKHFLKIGNAIAEKLTCIFLWDFLIFTH